MEDKIMIDEITQKLHGGKSLNTISVEKIIEYGENVGSKLAERKVKTHQIRRFFDVVKNINLKIQKNDLESELSEQDKAKLLMLKPQLANAQTKKNNLELLLKVVTKLLSAIHKKRDFDRFMNFFETVVAYHKANYKETQN